MKIKTKRLSYDEVMALPHAKHKDPKKPSILFRTIVRVASSFDLMSARFKYTRTDMGKAGKGPYLVLMNHSSFIDLEIASKIMYPRPYAIVSTTDGLVGKSWLMRQIGCIPTQKFVSDITLIRDILFSLNKNKTSVLMYPEAGYSFDGTATPIPRKLGSFIKRLGVPVVSIHTDGAFARDPLYNCLQKRKVKVTADMKCLLSVEEIKEKSCEEIEKILDDAFTFDNFAWQYENKIVINEPFRADGLERIIYKCASCGAEGDSMKGEGTELYCKKCGKRYTLSELGRLESEGDVEFPHIPDWYRWERECVKREIEEKTYSLDTEVEIGMLIDHKALYMVGEGRLIHDENGFTLTGCDGKLEYHQKPLSSYSLNSDYYWYEIGDVISIGNRDCLYYLFPKKPGVVTKARLAAEELYKIAKEEKKLTAK